MKRFLASFALCALCTLAGTPQVHADDLSELKAQVKELKQTVQSLQSTVESLSRTAASSSRDVSTETGGTTTQKQLQEIDAKVDKVVEAQKKVLPGEFNPAIGLVGETLYSYTSRGSNITGNDRPGGADVHQRSTELNVAASVDPFATGYAVINADADAATGEATLGIEEAALQTTSLPGNLTLKGGRFFAEFGRLAYIHDHELPFVNRPLVLDRYVGGESQTDGAQLSWLVPIEQYVNVTVGVGDKFGSPQSNPGDFRSGGELNYWGRASTYFELSPEWQVETGVSGMMDPKIDDRGGALTGPNGSQMTEEERRLIGADFSLRWVPLRDNQFQNFTWGTEVLQSENRYLVDPNATPGDGDEFGNSVPSWGMYTYMTYRWDRQWSAGGLFEYVENERNQFDQTKSYSVYLTYALSHWNQLRLQYTHTDRDPVSGLDDDDAVYLQWTWIIGSHSHGWQQR